MTGRYVVRRELPVLWTVLDTYAFNTEFVLFGEGSNYVRLWVRNYVLERPGGRIIALAELVETANRAGIRHTLRLPSHIVMPEPPGAPPVGRCSRCQIAGGMCSRCRLVT